MLIQKFLKAKHWQLFILTLGIPFVFETAMSITMFSTLYSDVFGDPTELFHLMKFLPVIMLVYTAVFYGWFWSIAIGLQKQVPVHIKMKTKKFKIWFFIPLVYLLLNAVFVIAVLNGYYLSLIDTDASSISIMITIMLLLNFIAMFGIFYAMYFVAKTFKTVELQKEVRFAEFTGEFLMIWFYFVGIWFLQPKINKMAKINLQ
ncbi:MAG TPA: hypothetical protein VLZ11_02265 [Flavobacterium sp.]|nr:hypothetical protein [Flavobacterium sp.]